MLQSGILHALQAVPQHFHPVLLFPEVVAGILRHRICAHTAKCSNVSSNPCAFAWVVMHEACAWLATKLLRESRSTGSLHDLMCSGTECHASACSCAPLHLLLQSRKLANDTTVAWLSAEGAAYGKAAGCEFQGLAMSGKEVKTSEKCICRLAVPGVTAFTFF